MPTPSRKIGFIGLGAMGYPMASRLYHAGLSMEVSDMSDGHLRKFVAEHPQSKALQTYKNLSDDVGVVILMLPDSNAVESVVLGTSDTDGLINILPPSSLIIDMSSSNPVRTRELAKQLEEQQISLIDAPVSGGVKKAMTGMLTIMAGGDPGKVKEVSELLSLMGSITHVGSNGCGHALKALNNYIAAVSFVSATEALLVAERFGLDLSLMTDVLNRSSGKNSATDYKVKQFILSGTFNSGFSLQLMAKDVGIALDLAENMGQALPLGEEIGKLWHHAAASHGPTDHTVMYKLIAERRPQ
ncbi:2-hydroxy-3-oxopropionate reductase [Advenella kashmirensis W13003]|uniref:2-hydroxy-3-oxopropionate reductase n=1 Tax=Advenella kashmirensis W13003 TaxID=1424334 RepID=V8QVI9_9BURK|nr:NAD(P)-dependent oxidoreductase [Advenella kashmirensis]ETF03368.1 2-hydroxy-3-oxopropionate reductase [Advenella kashmirensis W13003]